MTDHSRVSCFHLLLLLVRMVGAVKDMVLCFSGQFGGGGSVGVLSHCDIFFARDNRGVWARMVGGQGA